MSDLIVRRVPEVGWAVYQRSSGQKVSPPGERWWPNRRLATQARTEIESTTESVKARLEGGGAQLDDTGWLPGLPITDDAEGGDTE